MEEYPPAPIPQEREPLPFQELKQKISDLTKKDFSALEIMALIRNLRTSWEQNLDLGELIGKAGEMGDDFSPELYWLINSSDIVNVDELREAIRYKLSEALKGINQHWIRMVDGTLVGNMDLRFSSALDQIIDLVEPSIKDKERLIIKWEINSWSGATLANGQHVLQNRERLNDNEYTRVPAGELVFYMPKNLPPQDLNQYLSLAREMKALYGEPDKKLGRIHILLAKGEFVPRPAAAATGNKIIFNYEDPNVLGVFAHEYTHAFLGQTFGVAKAMSAMEGAAVYFAHKKYPSDKRGDYRTPNWHGYDDVVALDAARVGVGMSHTQLLENSGKKGQDQKSEFEYSYRFGAFLAEYIVTKYGVPTYLKFYEACCEPNLYDALTGERITENGKLVNKERSLIKQALRRAVNHVDIDQLEREFDQFIKRG